MTARESDLEAITAQVGGARIVRQVVGTHGRPLYHVASVGDTHVIGRWGSEDLLTVPREWSSALRLHGVLRTGELVASAPVDGSRRLQLVAADGSVRGAAVLEADEDVTVAGDHLLVTRRDGVLRADLGMTRRDRLFAGRVADVSADATASLVALVTAPAPTADVVVWREQATEPLRLVTGTPALRPVRSAACPGGCHLAVVVRRPHDRQVWVWALPSGERTIVLEHASDLLAWADDCTLVSVDDQWPHPGVWRTTATGARSCLGFATGAVTALANSARGVHAQLSSPGRPPAVVPLPGACMSDAARLPTSGNEVATRHGRLRVMRRRNPNDEGRDVILLHGGPYGLWRPSWDPMVDLLSRAGLRVHQLEAPYTAALRGSHTQFRPGDFGVLDAESVADAIEHISEGRAAPLVIGHSYGGFLAVRAGHLLKGSLGGLLLTSAIWRAADLAELRDDPASGRSLAAFLRHAYPPGTTIPDAELPTDVPVRVIHGAHDEIVPVRLIRAAVAATPQAQLTVLPDEGHVTRRAAAVATALREIRSWVKKVESLEKRPR